MSDLCANSNDAWPSAALERKLRYFRDSFVTTYIGINTNIDIETGIGIETDTVVPTDIGEDTNIGIDTDNAIDTDIGIHTEIGVGAYFGCFTSGHQYDIEQPLLSLLVWHQHESSRLS